MVSTERLGGKAASGRRVEVTINRNTQKQHRSTVLGILSPVTVEYPKYSILFVSLMQGFTGGSYTLMQQFSISDECQAPLPSSATGPHLRRVILYNPIFTFTPHFVIHDPPTVCMFCECTETGICSLEIPTRSRSMNNAGAALLTYIS